MSIYGVYIYITHRKNWLLDAIFRDKKDAIKYKNFLSKHFNRVKISPMPEMLKEFSKTI